MRHAPIGILLVLVAFQVGCLNGPGRGSLLADLAESLESDLASLAISQGDSSVTIEIREESRSSGGSGTGLGSHLHESREYAVAGGSATIFVENLTSLVESLLKKNGSTATGRGRSLSEDGLCGFRVSYKTTGIVGGVIVNVAEGSNGPTTVFLEGYEVGI